VPEPGFQQQQFHLHNSGQGTRQQVGGVKRSFSNFNEPPVQERIMSKIEFNTLPSRIKKGGHAHSRGRDRIMCVLCVSSWDTRLSTVLPIMGMSRMVLQF
jgi:hypothetical protein